MHRRDYAPIRKECRTSRAIVLRSASRDLLLWRGQYLSPRYIICTYIYIYNAMLSRRSMNRSRRNFAARCRASGDSPRIRLSRDREGAADFRCASRKFLKARNSRGTEDTRRRVGKRENGDWRGREGDFRVEIRVQPRRPAGRPEYL